VAGLAAVGGQVIGGALVESGLGWRACFLINVPVGIGAFALTARLVPESRADRRVKLDLAGTVLLVLGLTAILLPLIEGRQLGWPLWTWACLAVAPVLGALFLRRQQQESDPLLPLTLFRSRGFSGGLATQLFLACAQAAFFVYLALYLQEGRGLSALESGLVFTILAVAYVACSFPAPGLTQRFGRVVIACGGALLTAGLLVLAVAVGEDGALLTLVPGLLLVGAGIGFCFTPLTSTVLATVEPALAGGASGAMATITQVGYALGVAVTGIIFFGTGDIVNAFEVSLIQLAGVAAATVLATRALPTITRPGRGEVVRPSATVQEWSS
jgi:MFS family permease